jgi:hypothetical protein
MGVTDMTSTVTFFFVVQGKCHDTWEAALADQDTLLTDGYDAEIEAYSLIDGEAASVEEGERELQFPKAEGTS